MSEQRHQKATGQGGKYSRCGKSPLHDRKKCIACETICHRFGKKGHFQLVCISAKVQGVSSTNFTDEQLPWSGNLRGKK